MPEIVKPTVRQSVLPFPLEVPDYDAYLYWHVNAEADPANQWLREQVDGSVSGARQGKVNALCP